MRLEDYSLSFYFLAILKFSVFAAAEISLFRWRKSTLLVPENQLVPSLVTLAPESQKTKLHRRDLLVGPRISFFFIRNSLPRIIRINYKAC